MPIQNLPTPETLAQLPLDEDSLHFQLPLPTNSSFTIEFYAGKWTIYTPESSIMLELYAVHPPVIVQATYTIPPNQSPSSQADSFAYAVGMCMQAIAQQMHQPAPAKPTGNAPADFDVEIVMC
jgi:hypothetical protein